MTELIKDKLFISLVFFDAVLTVTAKLLHPVFTIYELLMIFYGTGCVFIYLFLVKRKKISISTVSLLRLMCLLMLGVAGYSTMTYGQASIHGDTAIATLLARAELKHGSLLPKTWCYANGDLWILDTQLAVMPFSLILKDQATARMLGTLLMMVIGMVSFYLLDRYVLKSDSRCISLPVILVFIFGGDGALGWGNGHMIYQASYTCWLFFIPVMVILVYSVFVREIKSRTLIAAYYVLALACISRGVRAIAEIMIPMAIACPAYELFLHGRQALKKWKRYILFILPMLAGCIIYKLICMTHIVNTSSTSGTDFVEDIDTVFMNARIVFVNLFRVFGYNEGCALASVGGLANMVSICCCLMFVIFLPLLELRKLPSESDGIRFFCIFGLIHNAEILMSTILFDKTSQSHILTFILVSVMMSSIYVMKYWIGDEKHAFIYGTLFITASLIMGAQLGLASRGWQGKVSERKAAAQTVIEHGLDGSKGYGTFWNIYPLGIYSDLRLDVAAIGNSDIALALNPHLNLVDTDKYQPDENKRSFIMLDYNEDQEMGAGLEKIYGKCSDRFNVGEYYFYVWDYDVAENDFGGRMP